MNERKGEVVADDAGSTAPSNRPDPLVLDLAEQASLKNLLQYVYEAEGRDAAEIFLDGGLEALEGHIFVHIDHLDGVMRGHAPDALTALVEGGFVSTAELERVSRRDDPTRRRATLLGLTAPPTMADGGADKTDRTR